MNFIFWLLKRMRRKIFGEPGSQSFCSKYRDFMDREFAGAILLTVLFGCLQFFVCSIIAVWVWSGRPPQWLFYILLASPVVFFLYNWLRLLYEYYDAERLSTWNKLKE